jgi:hypothetical protein
MCRHIIMALLIFLKAVHLYSMTQTMQKCLLHISEGDGDSPPATGLGFHAEMFVAHLCLSFPNCATVHLYVSVFGRLLPTGQYLE